jgi:hypothetical protein
VHAWFLATDRALGALVRLRGYAGQPKQGSGRVLIFLVVCFTSIGKMGLSSCGAGPLVGKGKRSKLAAILLLPGYYTCFLLLVPRRRFCFMYLPVVQELLFLAFGQLIPAFATTGKPTPTYAHCVPNASPTLAGTGPDM